MRAHKTQKQSVKRQTASEREREGGREVRAHVCVCVCVSDVPRTNDVVVDENISDATGALAPHRDAHADAA